MLLTGAATICELQLQHFFIGQQALSKCTCTFAAAASPRFMLRLQACTLKRQFFCLFLFCSCRNGREVTALHHNQFQRQNSCLWVVLAVDKNGIDALMRRASLTKLYTFCMSGHLFVATWASISCQREYVSPPAPPNQFQLQRQNNYQYRFSSRQ